MIRIRTRRRLYFLKVIRYYYRRPGYYAEYYAGEMAEPTPGANPTREDTSFRQYEILVDLYKHWLELILKYNGAYYIITGAMVSFCFSRWSEEGLRYSLLFPAALGIGLTIFAFKCVSLMKEVEDEFARLEYKLDLGLPPQVRFVKSLLRWSATFFIIVAVSLTLVVFIPLFWKR